MKKLILVLVISFSVVKSKVVHAQAWEKNTKVISLGVGLSQFYHLDNYYYYNEYYHGATHRSYTLLTEQFNLQGEFGIHKYVGLGFTTGVGGRGPFANYYNGEFNIPVGVISNFHFYQLIADNSKKNIHADKMDIYAGINIGSGIAFTFYPNLTRSVPLFFGGVHAGIRYYISDKVGVNAELGLGKSLINGGFVFKL